MVHEIVKTPFSSSPGIRRRDTLPSGPLPFTATSVNDDSGNRIAPTRASPRAASARSRQSDRIDRARMHNYAVRPLGRIGSTLGTWNWVTTARSSQ
eukprot:9285451-Pyramimonas_sp.AAC.1